MRSTRPELLRLSESFKRPCRNARPCSRVWQGAANDARREAQGSLKEIQEARKIVAGMAFSIQSRYLRGENCNAPDTTFHIRNSNSCLFQRCDMIFPSWLGFCILFCILFMSCISSHSIMHFAFACFHKTRSRLQLPFLSLPPLSLCQALVLVDLSQTPHVRVRNLPEPEPVCRYRWIRIIPKHL